MWQNQPNNSSYYDSIKALEDDIQHANTIEMHFSHKPWPKIATKRSHLLMSQHSFPLVWSILLGASALPPDYDGNYFQMKLCYNPFAPLFLYLIEWLDFSCTDTLPMYLGLLHILIYNEYVDGMPSISSKERRATIKEFYAVLYPSLRLLQGEFNNYQRRSCAKVSKRRLEKVLNEDLEGDEECGICMENRMKMVLPNCGHSLCISCFHDWYMRSESCPFCRGSLSRISPRDLWVVIGSSDVVDRITIAKENLRHLYLYIETLPPIIPDTHVYIFNHML